MMRPDCDCPERESAARQAFFVVLPIAAAGAVTAALGFVRREHEAWLKRRARRDR